MSELSSGTGAFRAPVAATAKTPQQRIGGIAFVAGIHAAIVYGLLTALGVVDVPKPPSDLTIVNVVEPLKREELPPPPMPVIEAPRIQNVIVPLVTLDYIPPQARAITAPTPPPAPPAPPQQTAVVQAPPPPPAPAEPAFVPPLSIAETHTIPDYPAVSRRLGERGTTHLMLTINELGIVSNATIMDSSGFKRLDEAAIAWIKTHWRYQPAREGSKAVSAQIEAEVEFRLL